jgi:hypothetical protein
MAAAAGSATITAAASRGGVAGMAVPMAQLTFGKRRLSSEVEVAADGEGWLPLAPVGTTPLEELDEEFEWSPTGYGACGREMGWKGAVCAC